MNKKYQVFISSTFTDLQDERKIVYDALLDADCIPAGMECFFAEDTEQFNVIKRVIDLCDFYVLIIGGKYGTIDNKTRKSYTEMEYEYAVEKDLPILVFPIRNVDNLPDDKKENESYRIELLRDFRNKAAGHRMGGIWSNSFELKYEVLKSIGNAKTKYNRPGWIRGDEKYTYDNIDYIIKENTSLRTELQKLKTDIDYDNCYSNVIESITYKNIFLTIGGGLLSFVPIEDFNELIDRLCSRDDLYYVDEKTHNKIKMFFVIYELLICETRDYNGTPIEMIKITEKGKNLLKNLIKK